MKAYIKKGLSSHGKKMYRAYNDKGMCLGTVGLKMQAVNKLTLPRVNTGRIRVMQNPLKYS